MTILKESTLLQLSLKKEEQTKSVGRQIESIYLPDECDTCNFSNYNIEGLLQNTRLLVKVSCMRCGTPLQKIDHKILT